MKIRHADSFLLNGGLGSRVKLRTMKITKTVKKLQFDLLRTYDEYTTQFQRHISEHMEGINIIDNVEDRYIKFRNALTEYAQQVLPDVA